ncbi:SUMF1/EgtB/PvdO family nonheme iron enzyme [Streptomyces erythrochromogenes]|uniref:SUMF1/EgtB/PvdO family nonheme iron enzyme n=1 Tax=Streptomyces erythrochromogenes TaxID=285574 RepID=UPI003697A227
MPLVTKWTGREVKALRESVRMSLMEFAEKLGVSDRIVSRWEADGERASIRMINQAALDTLLAKADKDAQGRFVGILAADDAPIHSIIEPGSGETSSGDYVKHPGDGKLMAHVPEGIYLSGADSEPVWVDDFHIDTFPTTNADYARFCAATRYAVPEHWENGRCPRDLYDHPVVHVTWRDATAYAAWAGKSLPTSEQWEKAARGTTGRTFPWGDQKTAAKCNVRETGIERTTSVSRYHSGVSPYGVYDMVGNVWEWLATATTAGRHELRGSAFTSPLFRGVPAVPNDAYDTMLDDDTGFRCVATPEQMMPGGQ